MSQTSLTEGGCLFYHAESKYREYLVCYSIFFSLASFLLLSTHSRNVFVACILLLYIQFETTLEGRVYTYVYTMARGGFLAAGFSLRWPPLHRDDARFGHGRFER